MEEKNTSVTDKIFELLKQQGISQRQLSIRTGISTSAISDWKHKNSMPSADKIQKICEVLNVSPDILYDTKAGISTDDTLLNDPELVEFINLYHNVDISERKRILTYAKEMLKIAGEMK